MMHLANPEFLWLFLLYIPAIIWYIYKQRVSQAELHISTILPFKQAPKSIKIYLRYSLFILRLLTISCLIIILCRPQVFDSRKSSEGIDIVLAMDVSTSMLAKDFTPNRFQAAKKVASQFVASRQNDNMGLVIFAGEGFTAVPMTTDVTMLSTQINDLSMGLLEDGTAIGDGLSMAINRIANGDAKSKVIILLTDGTNNTGLVTPMTAAEIAKEKNIKVYVIGIGTNGVALVPIATHFGQIDYGPQQVEIDEKTLTAISKTTGGKYYRATDNDVLKQIFDDIDKLEKSKIKVNNFTHAEDDYMSWAWLALSLFILEFIIRYAVLRLIP